MKLIGFGGTRVVYELNDDIVLKVPKRDQKEAGHKQNENEYDIYVRTKAPMLAEVKGWMETEHGLGLLMERLQPIDWIDESFINFLQVQRKGIRAYVTEEQLRQFAIQNELSFHELLFTINWGVTKDGVLKLFDYGRTLEVCELEISRRIR